LLGVAPYVLRFWETEFAALAPKKSDTGHRLFRRKDVELLFKIKDLLYNKRFTIEGARQALQQQKRVPETQQHLFAPDPLPQIRDELASLLELLSH
jgi:DNA-binding transcriptional MerR regulator